MLKRHFSEPSLIRMVWAAWFLFIYYCKLCLLKLSAWLLSGHEGSYNDTVDDITAIAVSAMDVGLGLEDMGSPSRQ